MYLANDASSGKIFDLYCGMEYGFTSRGYKLDCYNDDITVAQHGFKWTPFQFGWHPTWGKFSIDPHIGVNLTLWYYGYTKYDGETTSQYDWDDSDVCTYLSLSMPIGIGFWFNNKFNFDLTAEPGLTNAFNADSDVCHYNFMIRIGYAF